MRISERFDADLEKDDAKFVGAALDDDKRSERLGQLEKSRRAIHKVAVIHFILFVVLLLLNCFQFFFLKERPDLIGWQTILTGGMALFYLIMFFYLDIQVKFLKATSN